MRHHPRICGWRQPSAGDASQSGRRLHPGDAQHEGVKLGLQLREPDDRTGNPGEHVLNQRDDVRNRRDQIGNRRHPGDAQQEGVKVRLQLRGRDDRTGNRVEHVLNQRDDVRNWPDQIAPGAAASGAGATASGAGATASRAGATASRAGATASVAGATTFVTAATRPESFVSSSLSVSPVAFLVLRVLRAYRAGGRLLAWLPARAKRARYEARVGSVPPGPSFGLIAPVEGCWPGCRPEPSVLVTSPESFVSSVTVPPGACFGFFGSFWPEASVPSSLYAAEPLDSGSATATAPPAPPISRPAASTQIPAAKRKRDRPTICSPTSHRIAHQQSNVWQIVASYVRAVKGQQQTTINWSQGEGRCYIASAQEVIGHHVAGAPQPTTPSLVSVGYEGHDRA